MRLFKIFPKQMESKLHLLSVFTLILISGKISAASWWNPERTAILDRTIPATNDTKPEDSYILPVDRTTFSVSKEVRLQQIDIAKIFTKNAAGQKTNVTDNVSVKVKIVQMQINDRTFIATVFNGKANLSSMNDTKITFKDGIPLKRYNMYEIQLFMPALNFVYSDNLSIATHKIWRAFLRSIVTSFFPSNVNIGGSDGEKKISVGLVKRLHYKYTKF